MEEFSIIPTIPPSTMPAHRKRCSFCFASMSRRRTPNIRRRRPKTTHRLRPGRQIRSAAWPQRWPADPRFPAYSSYITFNDDVAAEKSAPHHVLAGARRYPVRDSIIRARRLPGDPAGAPQPPLGLGLQYTLDLKPRGARSYEPRSLVTHTPAPMSELMNFYR